MKKRIVRQVGYLQRLHGDARSTEHKTLRIYYYTHRKSWQLLGG